MTETDIANLALGAIGKGTIHTMDDDNDMARTIKHSYDHIRQILLQEYPWSFAQRRETLDLLAETIPGWAYSYIYPAHALHIERVMAGHWAVMNGDLHTKVICTDTPAAWCDYVYDVKDPDVFSALFIEAFYHRMAAEMAIPMGGNDSLYTMQYQLYQAAVAMARTKSAQEMTVALCQDSSYVRARR